MLGIPYVVAHPGAYTNTSEEAGIAQIVRALDEVHERTPGLAAKTLLENTAGQGSSLGWRFEHLAAIIAGVKEPERLGVCIDTCHTFAAGYPLAPKKAYLATMGELDRIVGLGSHSGVSSERQQKAARLARRSARAYRQGPFGLGAVSAAR